MKRWFTVLIALAAALALCGAALALTADTRTALRSSLGQGMITASVIGLLLCAVLRPKAAKADAGGMHGVFPPEGAPQIRRETARRRARTTG